MLKIGDFTEFSQQYNVGLIVDDEIPFLKKVNQEDKNRIRLISSVNFVKDSVLISKKYELLINNLS